MKKLLLLLSILFIGQANAQCPVTVNSAAICIGQQTATLTATGATSYSWDPSTGLSTTNGSVVIANPSVTTSYTVTGVVGSCTSTAVSTVTVNSLPFVTATTCTVCAGQTCLICASGASTYSWVPLIAISSSTGSCVNISPTVTTNYTVTGTDLNGCVSSTTSSIIINPLPQATITASNDSICIGQSDTLIAYFSPNTISHVWQPIGISSASVIITPTTTTTYGLSLMDAYGCANGNSITITVLSCVGINEFSNTNGQINVFPNPTNGQLYIDASSTDKLNISLYDVNGRHLFDKNISDKSNIDVTALDEGVYTMIIKTADHVINKKLVIIH